MKKTVPNYDNEAIFTHNEYLLLEFVKLTVMYTGP